MAKKLYPVVMVTVGTTKFHLLIERIFDAHILQALQDLGCRRLIIQHGCSSLDSDLVSTARDEYGFDIQCYPYKTSIQEDVASADLVIGHAGAGTTIEVLRSNKVFITVINTTLMDNHQTELADAFSCQGYLVKCFPESLENALEKVSFQDFAPTAFPAHDPSRFRNYLDSNVFL